MLSIGTCPTCRSGPLGLRTCGVCRRVVVLCDECDAAWPDTNVSAPATTGGETMPCPGCASDLWSSGSGWATHNDATATAWLTQPGIELTEGASFEPRL